MRLTVQEAQELELAALTARVAELERDAGRYRWLRDDAMQGNGTSSSPQVNMSDDRSILCGDELDAAIDAARGTE